MGKRILNTTLMLIVSVVLIAAVVGTESAYAQDDGVYKKLISLQEKFPDGKYWNHIVPAEEAWQNCSTERYADSCTDCPCTRHGANVGEGSYDCNYFDGGLQCCGFAKKIFYDVFGERESSGDLKRIPVSAGVSVGDFVRFSGAEHYAVVLSISGTSFTVVECNLDKLGADYNCIIRWGREYQLSQIDYYVHSNNYESVNVSCEHNFRTVKVKAATLKQDGIITKKCTKCNEVVKETIHKPQTISCRKSEMVYSGKSLKPGVSVVDSEGNIIKPKYYSVSYSNNKDVGTATATIKFRGNYAGTKKITFSIVPKSTKLVELISGPGTITVKWKKNTAQTSGYQIQYSTDPEFNDAEIVTIANNKITSRKISNLFAVTDYYVRIRAFRKIGNKRFSSKWSLVSAAETQDLATEYITKKDFTGTYYTTDKDPDSDPMIVKIDSNTIKLYLCENGEISFLNDIIEYSLSVIDGRTILNMTDDESEESFQCSVTYFKEQQIIWIDGGEFLLLHKHKDKYLNYRTNWTPRTFMDFSKFFAGTWQDLRDADSTLTSKFDENTAKSELIISLPYFGVTDFNICSDEHYGSGIGDDFEIWWNENVWYDGNNKVMDGSERSLIMDFISDDLGIAYYTDCRNGSDTTFGHGTIFRRK